MRLCFVNPHDWPRTVVYDLAKHLMAKGDHEITIVRPSRGSRFVGEPCSRRISDGVETIFYPAFFLRNISYNIPNLLSEIKILSKLLSEEKCEIIQGCDQSYLANAAPVLVKKRYKVPIVLTTDNLPGYSWFYGDAFVDVVAKSYTYSLGKWMLNSYDRLVFLYTKALNEVGKFGVPRNRVCSIPNGVDLEKFQSISDNDDLRSELSVGDDEKVLLFVGRLAKVKRVDILIALTRSLIEEGYKVKTILVGDGPDRKLYEKLASPTVNNVMFVGQVPRNKVHEYYHLADVFVLPSLSEGLPQVLLEASAAGKPCVATNVNGASDIIVHGETGYLIERSDVDGYRRYVKILLEDEDLSRRMGIKAAKFVEENFSWDVVVDRYEKVYEDIVNARA